MSFSTSIQYQLLYSVPPVPSICLTNPSPCACANANISLPIYDITSLSPLPAEIRNLVHSFLIAAPCKAHNLIFTRLSRDHYTTLVPRLYRQIVVTDKAVDAGLYRSFSNVDNQSHQSNEHRTLPSKKELLDGCESLVFTSLYAWTQSMDILRRPGQIIPNPGLKHVAFASGLVEEICRIEYPRLCVITPRTLWYITDACIHLPESISEDLARRLGNMANYLDGFGFGTFGTETVLRFHNGQPTKMSMADTIVSFEYDVMSIDMSPTRIENPVYIPARQVDEIVEYCVKTVTEWDRMNTRYSDFGPPGPVRTEIVFTNFGTVITPAGLVFIISPSIAQSVFDRAESEVRRRVRLFLESELPARCGLEANFHVRGYKECRFCPRRMSSSG